MKKLTTRDMISACRVIAAADIRDRLAELATARKEDKNIEKVGFAVLYEVIAGLTQKNAEKLLYDFLASPFEMTADEVAEMEFSVFCEKMKELAEVNDLQAFFDSVSKMKGML